MITIVCSSINPDPSYQEHVLKHIGLPSKKVEFLHYENKGKYSLTELYNIALNESTNDLVLFMHDDLILETKSIFNKINRLFDKNPDYGIIGLAGTKELTDSGRWWDNPKQMFGRVKHQHEGKTWSSNYSDDLNNNLEETINVDGLFFVVKKSRIKTNFNENYDGFHFYDLVFSLENHLLGVKIGVTTSISVIHKSIGQTNDKWEELRIKFVEDFKEKLPIKIEQTFNNVKMEVLIGCLSFKELTGSELYTYELSKGLIKENVNVSVVSNNVGEPLLSMAKRLGIKVYNLNEPPNYIKGDGIWKLPNGELSKENVLYPKSLPKFDIIHTSHRPITEHLLKLYPNSKFVTTIHSEIIPLENPINDDRIKKYISIRNSISDKLINDDKIEASKIIEIYNPIDENKFNTINTKVNDEYLFVGTIDYLRINAIKDIVELSKNENKKVRIVGRENSGFKLSDVIDLNNNQHVSYEKERSDIEKLVKNCYQVVGIKKGRTTIEGWLCGKNSIIYDVDQSGNILNRHFVDHESVDLEKYRNKNIINSIIELYKKVINE